MDPPPLPPIETSGGSTSLGVAHHLPWRPDPMFSSPRAIPMPRYLTQSNEEEGRIENDEWVPYASGFESPQPRLECAPSRWRSPEGSLGRPSPWTPPPWPPSPDVVARSYGLF
jgi:hypothetical protein